MDLDLTIKHVNFINPKIKKNIFSEHIDINPNGFKMYMTSLFIGAPRSGKTTSAIQLADYLQNNKLITEIFLLSPTVESNKAAFKCLNIPDENMFDDLERSNEILTSIENNAKYNVEQWKLMKEQMTEKQYNKTYARIYKLHKLQQKYDIQNNEFQIKFSDNYDDDDEYKMSDEDFEMLIDNNFEKEPYYYQYGPSYLIILDDILGSNVISKKTNNKLNKIIANHRHSHLNIFILTQYYRAIPKSIRSNVKQFFLWKIQDIIQMKIFYDEIANNFFNSFDEFKYVFINITSEPHNFLCIDQDPKNDNLKIRSGFNGIISERRSR